MAHQLIVFQGPSASGKSTLQTLLGLPKVTTWTSRRPRDGERHAVDYYFSDQATMQAMREEGKFLEMTRYNGELYGTALESFDRIFAGGERRSIVLDEFGARKLKSLFADKVLLIGVYAEKDDCRQRLASRGTEEAARRLATYDEEIRALAQCDLVINNADTRLHTAEAAIRYLSAGLRDEAEA